MATSAGDSQLQDQAFSERRLGLMILENKNGAALAAGIPHLQAALDIWRKLAWATRIAELQIDLGNLHRKAGNHAESAKEFSQAMTAFAGANDERAIDAAVLAGNAFLDLNQQVEALAVLGRAAELADERNDHLRIAAVQIDLGRAQVAAGNAPAALAAAERAMKIFGSFKRKGEVARCHELYANAHTVAGNSVGWPIGIAITVICQPPRPSSIAPWRCTLRLEKMAWWHTPCGVWAPSTRSAASPTRQPHAMPAAWNCVAA